MTQAPSLNAIENCLCIAVKDVLSVEKSTIIVTSKDALVWQIKVTLIVVALLQKFIYELRRNNVFVTQDNQALILLALLIETLFVKEV